MTAQYVGALKSTNMQKRVCEKSGAEIVGGMSSVMLPYDVAAGKWRRRRWRDGYRVA